MTQWRLYPEYFKNGPGKYCLQVGEAKVEIEVDDEGVFESSKPVRPIPLYGFAAIVGSNRDAMRQR